MKTAPLKPVNMTRSQNSLENFLVVEMYWIPCIEEASIKVLSWSIAVDCPKYLTIMSSQQNIYPSTDSDDDDCMIVSL